MASTKDIPAGLVVEGNSRDSRLFRLPRLVDTLGPVKGANFGLARRLSNYIHAGYPITEYEELQNAHMVLVHVPDTEVPRIVQELAGAGLSLANMCFVLTESWLPIDVLYPLKRGGATVATMRKARTSRLNWFIVEGDFSAVAHARRFIERNEARAHEIRSDAKHVYFAAELMVNALPIPLLVAADRAFRNTGLWGNNLNLLIEESIQDMFREFLRGGLRKPWGGPLTECDAETAEAHLAALRKSYPDLAEVIDYHLPVAQTTIATFRPLEAPAAAE